MKWIVTERFNVLIFMGVSLMVIGLLHWSFGLDMFTIGITYIVTGVSIMVFYKWKVVE